MASRSAWVVLAGISSSLLLGTAAGAQVVINGVNDEGVTAPCIGIGVGLLLEKKCLDAMGKAGFVRSNELGHTGLTLADLPVDGVGGPNEPGAGAAKITAVEAGSPAAMAGLVPGDVLLAVDGVPVPPAPAAVATELLFGAKDEPVRVKLRHGENVQVLEMKRAQGSAPELPKIGGFMVATRPLVDWRGKFIPCISAAGPTGLPTLIYCEKHYRKDGYVRATETGTTGITFDEARRDGAIVRAVAAGSPGAAAGVVPGDRVEAVDDKPLTGSASAHANLLLFGKVGDERSVTVRRNGAEQTVKLKLAAKT